MDLNITFYTESKSVTYHKVLQSGQMNLKEILILLAINFFNKNADLLFSTDSTLDIFQNFLKYELVVLLQKDSSSLSNLYLGNNKSLIQAIITPVKNSGEILGYMWTEVSFFEYLSSNYILYKKRGR